jgi:hypothetical protein
VHLWREDARTVLKLDPQLYDVIVAQPSNPWTVGIGSVFSREFYQISASRLKPGGIMAQWFHIYEMHDGIVELVLRTFGSVFPFVEIWDAGSGDIILLGSMEPWPSNPTIYMQSFDIPGVKSDFAKIDISSPEVLWARQLASQRTAFAIPGDGPVQSDLFPVLEYAAPRAFYIGVTAKSLENYDERTRQIGLAPVEKITVLKSLQPAQTLPMFLSFSTVNKELIDSLEGKGDGANAPCVFQKPILAAAQKSKETNATFRLASAALNAGDLPKSLELATTALKENQTDAKAAYLMRIIERQQILSGHNSH